MNGVFAEQPDGSLRLVSDWNGIYSGDADPWGQAAVSGPMAEYYRHSRYRTARTLKEIGARGNALEIGCGHGHAIAAYRMMGPMLKWQGADICDEAIAAARAKYPSIPFRELDIANVGEPEPEFDVIVLGECWWYLLERIGVALTNCYAMLNEGGALVITQGFLRDQRYGCEIANGFDGALRLMARDPGFKLIHAHFDESADMPLQHGVLAFRATD